MAYKLYGRFIYCDASRHKVAMDEPYPTPAIPSTSLLPTLTCNDHECVDVQHPSPESRHALHHDGWSSHCSCSDGHVAQGLAGGWRERQVGEQGDEQQGTAEESEGAGQRAIGPHLPPVLHTGV